MISVRLSYVEMEENPASWYLCFLAREAEIPDNEEVICGAEAVSSERTAISSPQNGVLCSASANVNQTELGLFHFPVRFQSAELTMFVKFRACR